MYVAEEIGYSYQVIGFNAQSGAPTGFDVYANGDSGAIGLNTYSGGVVVSTASNASYYGYDAQLLGSYDTNLGEDGYSYANGANGVVFVGGFDSSCHANVVAIAPGGIQWEYQDPASTGTAQPCGQTGLVATPNGGAVLQAFGWGGDCQGSNSDFVSVSATGTKLWAGNIAAPSGYQDLSLGGCFLVVADEAGNVVLGQDFSYTCSGGAVDACSGIQFEIVDEQTGNGTAPSFAQTDASGDWWLSSPPSVSQAYNEVTSDAGDLYVASSSSDDVAGIAVPGLATDYRQVVQELTAPG